MSVVNSTPLLLGDDGYQISRSVRLRSSASAYFNRTPASTGNRTTWTWSGWVKRGAIGASGDLFGYLAVGSQNNQHYLGFSTDSLYFVYYPNGANSLLTTTQVFRDPSAWYHIVAVWDTTNATATNRMRLYVNGVQVTVFASANYPALNQAGLVNVSGNGVGLGAAYPTVASGHYFDGYLTEVNFIDGQALTPSSFGETNAVTGVWQPKKYTGTYGTNGFYLNFADNSAATAAAIGADKSGNGNNWTPNNISVTAGATYDGMIDVPTMYADGGNGRGNYAVLNPLNTTTTTSITGGNLNFASTGINGSVSSTLFLPNTGKFYFEGVYTTLVNNVGTTFFNAGLVQYRRNGAIFYNTQIATIATWTINDVISLAADIDAATVAIYKNNTLLYTVTGVSLENAVFGSYIESNGSSGWLNFGQRPFTYTPPTGFKALNTQNLPDSTIPNGANYMAALLHTGNGAASQNVTGALFQPDFAWMKARSTIDSNILVDIVRGGNAGLKSDSTNAEVTTGIVDAWLSNGITVNLNVNVSGRTYVDWLWKAGGAAVTNNAGSISAQVSANAAASVSRSPRGRWFSSGLAMAAAALFALVLAGCGGGGDYCGAPSAHHDSADCHMHTPEKPAAGDRI